MAGRYPDADEDPQAHLNRLTLRHQRDCVRAADRPIHNAGVQWANAQLAKSDASVKTVAEAVTPESTIMGFLHSNVVDAILLTERV